MKKPFSTETPSYHENEPVTPYQKAGQIWDDRIGSARVQAKNWRFIAMLSMLVSLVLLMMLIISLSLDQSKVYVAQVEKSGQVINVAPLMRNYTPTGAEQEYFLAYFIQLIRSVPLDPVVAKQNWMNAYQFLTQRASQQLNTLMREDNPLALLGKQTVTVKILDINALSDNTYHVDWLEKTVDASGQIVSTKNYSGTFTLINKTPSTQQEILQNPLGIYIVDFNLSMRENV